MIREISHITAELFLYVIENYQNYSALGDDMSDNRNTLIAFRALGFQLQTLLSFKLQLGHALEKTKLKS